MKVYYLNLNYYYKRVKKKKITFNNKEIFKIVIKFLKEKGYKIKDNKQICKWWLFNVILKDKIDDIEMQFLVEKDNQNYYKGDDNNE